MRTRLDSVVTLPTEGLVVGDLRCCCSAMAGGNPSTAIHVEDRHLAKPTRGNVAAPPHTKFRMQEKTCPIRRRP
jgi:hypothetical protein